MSNEPPARAWKGISLGLSSIVLELVLVLDLDL
jgi:hypothetical protein